MPDSGVTAGVLDAVLGVAVELVRLPVATLLVTAGETEFVGRVIVMFSISCFGPSSESQPGGSGLLTSRRVEVAQPTSTNITPNNMNEDFNTRQLCEGTLLTQGFWPNDGNFIRGLVLLRRRLVCSGALAHTDRERPNRFENSRSHHRSQRRALRATPAR